MNPDFRDILSAFNAEGVEYDVIFQVGVSPRRVDVLTTIDGVEFAAAWQDRLTASLGDLNVPVLSREHLIRNKRACGRPKDLADLAWLERAP